jgi:hypothetical protein
MKRKRSLDEPGAMGTWRKSPKETSAARAAAHKVTVRAAIMDVAAADIAPSTDCRTDCTSACPLIQALRQYGLLEAIISSLIPSDLLSLALACKDIYNAMFPRAESLDNLLSRIQCCGSGIALRRSMHRKSTFFYAYECTEFAQCSTVSGRHIRSQPCISCKVTTCDECRIHCVYQSIYEAPSDPEDLPNFSGFVLLDPLEVAILSPNHLPSELASSEASNLLQWRNRAADTSAGPYHDQGFLDMPLEIDQPGNPEKISDVLDVDLGLNSLTTWSGNSQFGFPSPVLRTLCRVAEERKLFMCEVCFDHASDGPKALKPSLPRLPWLIDRSEGAIKNFHKQCHCTLRSRVLDRWQCIKCFDSEDSIIKDIHNCAPSAEVRRCRCEAPTRKTVCMWCWSEIIEERARHQSARIEQTR